MFEQGLLKTNFVGNDGFIWWIGQVVDAEEWKFNIPGYPVRGTNEILGFDYRYKVRIMGYHPGIDQLADSELPWASVMLPVTSGTGAAAAFQTPQIRQGDFVYGFFLDGEDGQQPIIFGLIGRNQYTKFAKEQNIEFEPFSGYDIGDTVARFSLVSRSGSDGSDGISGGSGVNDSGGDSKSGANEENKESIGDKTINVPKPSDCEPIPLGKAQLEIKNLLKKIEKYQATLDGWEGAIATKVGNIRKDVRNDFSSQIDNLIKFEIDGSSKSISETFKWLITTIQEKTTSVINETLKKTYFLIPPNRRNILKNAKEKGDNLINCLFRKIIKNLFNMVRKFLLEAVNRFINVPLCAIENLIGSLVGKILGIINSTLDKVLKPFESIVGSAFDLAGSILDVVKGILSFLSCDDEPTCPETDTWSFWNGPSKPIEINVERVFDKVKNVASSVTQAVDDVENFDFDLDFSDVFQDTCNVGPILCGPPKVSFFGGGGSGAAGNVIVSATGSILGVDIITPGSGYSSAPFVNFEDDCGNGAGASGRAILNTDGGVEKVILDDGNGGRGYNNTNNGAWGGDGRQWADAGSTIVNRADGTWDSPYSPGDVIDLFPGDQVSSCAGPFTTIQTATTITAPVCTDATSNSGGNGGQDNPTSSEGQYPIVLEIDEIDIQDSGLGYENGDNVVISPDNGAVVDVTYTNGAVTGVNVLNGGSGFTEMPSIYIQSTTGVNAKLVPVFKVNRIGNDTNIDFERLSNGDIIKVVDCVGRH